MLKKNLGLALMLSLSLCLFGKAATAGETKGTLYYIPIVETGTYWTIMKIGAMEKARELGYELILRTSPPAEVQKNEKHMGFLTEAIMQGAAGIAIAPMDPDMFDRRVAEAKDAGIPVVTFDADVATKTNRVSFVGTDNFSAGQLMGRQGAKTLKEQGVTSGKLALAAVNLSQTNIIARREGVMDGFKQEMGAAADKFVWLEPILDEDQSSVSKSQLEGQIVANQDMVMVFSLGSEGPDTGVMEALKSQGKNIPHLGFDYTPTWENGVSQGLIYGIIDQDSYGIGAETIQALVDAIDGKTVPTNIAVPAEWVPASEIVNFGKGKQEIMSRQ